MRYQLLRDNDADVCTSTHGGNEQNLRLGAHYGRRTWSRRWYDSYMQSRSAAIVNLLLVVACSALVVVMSEQEQTCGLVAANTYCEYQSAIRKNLTLKNSAPLYSKASLKRHTSHNLFTFWPEKSPSIFQQRPSDEVTRAWEDISLNGFVCITSTEAVKMGKDVATLFPCPGSSDTFLAEVDVFHELHCLDMLRRAGAPDFYGDLRAKYKDELLPFEDHLLHCQYVLARALMCHADAEIITFNKVKGIKGPYADFSVERRCNDFDGIVEWQRQNEQDLSQEQRFFVPPNIRQLPAEGRILPFSQPEKSPNL
jgi:hypothetical protein